MTTAGDAVADRESRRDPALEGLLAAVCEPGDGPAAGRIVDAARRALGAEWARIGDHAAVQELTPGAVRVPLVAGGQTVGVLEAGGGGLDPERARAVADVVALAIAADRLRADVDARDTEIARRAMDFSALDELARAAGRLGSVEPLARVVARQAARVVSAPAAAVVVKPHSATGPRVVAQHGTDPPKAWAAAFAAVASGVPQVLPGPQVAVPIAQASGTAVGAVAVAREGPAFDDAEMDRLRLLADHAGLAFTNLRLLEDLRAEQARRAMLAAALVDVQEQERARVAEDLHDGPVQELSGLGLLLDAVAGQLSVSSSGGEFDPAENEAAVRWAAETARRAVGGIRHAIYDLHPLSLEELGFTAAVRGMMERLDRGSLVVELTDLEIVDQLARDTRTAAFRVVQEAIANALRHASASSVRVQGRRAQGQVVVDVTDDGVGFDTEGRAEEGHLGLAVMRERAAVLGGSVHVWSREGFGTRVRARFPLPPPEKAG